jgi:hypothetical protein
MAETSQLLIRPTFNLRVNPQLLSIEDITNYASINPTYTSIYGIFECTSPSGVSFHKTVDYDNPDINYSGRVKTNIALPRDANDEVVQGNYIIFYQVLIDGVYHYKTFAFTYSYIAAEIALTITPDGYNSNISFQDTTSYSAYDSISRTMVVTPPTGSSLSPQTTTGSTITYNPNIWSGEWGVTVTTLLQDTIDEIIVLDTITDTQTVNVYKIDMDVIRGYIKTFRDTYLTALTSNLKQASQIAITLTKIDSYLGLYYFAVLYQDYLEAYNNAKAIVELLSPTIITSQEITPFEDPGGGGTPPIDDKWDRTSGILYPRIITDKLAIGTTTMAGSELLRVLGIISSTTITLGDGDGAERIGVDGSGNLLFTDAISGSKTLAQLLLGWQPANYATLETYTQTEANLSDAVSKKHTAITINSAVNTVLLLTGQELNIVYADATHDGIITSTIYNTFNGKQAGNATLTSLSGITLAAGDILYSTAANTLTKLTKGSTGQFLRQGTNYPEWYSISSAIQGADTQVIFNSGGTAYTGDSGLTYTVAQQLLYAYNLTTEKINFNSASFNISYISGGISINCLPTYISLHETNGIEVSTTLLYASEPTYTDDLQLVHKGYVDALASLEPRSGLTESSGYIDLGGALSSAADITGNYDISLERLYTLSSAIFQQANIDLNILDGYNAIEYLVKYQYGTGNYYQTLIEQEYNAITLTYLHSYDGDTSSIIFDTNGFSYSTDLSTKNTANLRWLVDMDYVLKRDIGIPVTCTANTTEYIILGSSTTYHGFMLSYVLYRGSRIRSNNINVIHDGVDVTVTDAVGIKIPDTEGETCGVTITGRINAGNVELIIAVDNSDAIDATFIYTLQKF